MVAFKKGIFSPLFAASLKAQFQLLRCLLAILDFLHVLSGTKNKAALGLINKHLAEIRKTKFENYLQGNCTRCDIIVCLFL